MHAALLVGKIVHAWTCMHVHIHIHTCHNFTHTYTYTHTYTHTYAHIDTNRLA